MAERQTKQSAEAKTAQMGIWIRLVYMTILGFAWVIAEVVLLAVVVLQFLFKVMTGNCIERLIEFGDALAEYMARIVRFEAFVSEGLAFPFAPWPAAFPQVQAGTSSQAAGDSEFAEAEPDSEPATAAKPKGAKARTGKRPAPSKPEIAAAPKQP